MAIEEDGCGSLRNTPAVALMMPAPISTISGSVFTPASVKCSWCRSMLLPLAFARGAKGDVHAGLQHDVDPPPWGAVGESPTVARAHGIFGQQDVAWMKGE